jgi:hypothetical protein
LKTGAHPGAEDRERLMKHVLNLHVDVANGEVRTGNGAEMKRSWGFWPN